MQHTISFPVEIYWKREYKWFNLAEFSLLKP